MFDWVTNFVEESGYLGVALLMLLENIFPPIPSELIMPLAGYAANEGDLNLALVILAGSIGSIAGTLVWYYIGVFLSFDRVHRFAKTHGRWLTLKPRDVTRARKWFQEHGARVVFFGRLVPAVRTLISLPAGITAMALPKFLAYTAAGTVVWTGVLAGAGYVLGSQHEQIQHVMDPASNLIMAGILLWYGYRVVTFRSGKTAS
jgi:membrane protein DedA with SNARE-associated domain